MGAPKNGAIAESTPMNSSALTGVRCLGCIFPNQRGSIPEFAMAHSSREAPMRNAIQEVMIPASPPAITTLPHTVLPVRAAKASAVTSFSPVSSEAGSAMDVLTMIAT